MKFATRGRLFVLAAATSLVLSSAHAASLALSYEQTAAGITGAGAVSVVSVPGSSTYAQTFVAPQSAISGAPSAPESPGYFGFYDDFLFSVSSGSIDSISSTIDLGTLLGISNLEARLYNTGGNTSLPVLGAPSGGAIDAWSTDYNYAPGLSGTVAVLPSTVLGAGTYVLEIRGTAIGSSGGSYSGVLNVAAVPLPAGLPLLLSGLGLLRGLLRRRSLS